MAEPRRFCMPSLGADMTEGSVLEWLVQPGDRVHHGDLVAVIKTDKADIEAEVFDDGVIGELLVAAGGEPVPIGTPLATIVDTEPAPVPVRAPDPSESPLPSPPAAAAPPSPAPVSPSAPAPPSGATPAPALVPQSSARVAASPYARRRAAELGVDLARVAPGQAGHPISAADVERAATRAPSTGSEMGDQATGMRRAIANLMARSKREIPHYYLEDDIELTHAMAWLAHHNETVPVDERVLPAALLYKAVALATRDTPALNGYWTGDAFVPGDGVHLGIAIALRGGGLVAPAIRDADQLPLVDIMARLRDLAARVRGGRLRASEMTDATLTVTSLGDQGVRAVLGVIYAPQVALVGFGKIAERAWNADGAVALRPIVTATLSADHRATDGHIGARFLAGLARYLDHPEEL